MKAVAVGALVVALGACGDDDFSPETPAPGVDAGPRGGSSSSGAEPADGAPNAEAPAEAAEPVGLEALSPEVFADLARLRLLTRVHHASSAAPDGGNADYGHAVGTDVHGDAVLWDRSGPGALDRIWVTGFSPEQHVKMYFDGEAVPRVDASIAQLFGGSTAPFLAPLSLDAHASSGGFLSLLPFPYAASLTVTVTGGARYYNVDGHDLPGAVASFTGAEDSGAARAFLARAGTDPKPTSSTQRETSTTFDVDAGADYTLLDVAGPRSVDAIELVLPGVFPLGVQPSAPALTTEDGRALAGESRFVLAVEPNNHGVMLQRRIDYGVGSEHVQVAADGAALGEWTTLGSDPVARWRDVGFWLPESITVGKTQLAITLAGARTEYRVGAITHGERARTLTDQVDVGNAASEVAHAYTAADGTFVSTTARLPSHAELAPLLNQLRLVITWNDEATPSVDAPVGSLFGVGAFGPGLASGVGAGLRADGTLYLYFPMPFAERARVVLKNVGAAVVGVRATVRHRAFAGSFDDVGAFTSSFTSGPSTPGADSSFLAADGSGQVVAVSQSVQCAPSRGFMQGDERIYVDGARTPVVQGTGTEDFYNGGFYFGGGPFGLATHGESVLVPLLGGAASGTAMYRQFLSDPIPYRAGAVMGIEHGAQNDVDVVSTTLALYYRQPRARLVETDVLVVGDGGSESAHVYGNTGETARTESTFTFEGDHDDEPLVAIGRSHRGSHFELAVEAAHESVTLRRLFDQLTPQRAEVWVDGEYAGLWYTAEHNAVHRFREEDFPLPPARTAGKVRLHVEIRVLEGAPAWNEYELRALCSTR